MDIGEATKLVEDWNLAVAHLWQQVVDKAKAGTVAVPVIMGEIGCVKVILSQRGVEVVIASTGTRFADLLKAPAFRLADFGQVRKLVVDGIRKGHTDVDKAIEERQDAFGTAFVDLKKEIAEWNLISESGKEVKPR